MKKLLFLLLLALPGLLFSQPVSLGCFSGIGFSDIHGKYTSGRFSPETGPVLGTFFNYSFSPVFSLGTELAYTRQVYGYQSYSTYPYPPIYPEYFQFRNSQMYYYDPGKQVWNYDFLRVPVYFTLSTPTRLRLSFSAGIYVSFQTRHDISQLKPFPPIYDFRNYYYNFSKDVPRHDNGLFYSLSLSYPINDHFSFFASSRYVIGRKNFIDFDNGRTGASEIVMGLTYNGHSKKNSKYYGSDSTSRLSITAGGGLGISGIAKSEYASHYKSKNAGMISIGIDYKLDENVSLVTGLRFERKGYAFNDSSLNYFRHELSNNLLFTNLSYKADTRVDLDYAVIPVMMRFSFGNTLKMFMQFGFYAGFNLNDRVTGDAVRDAVYTNQYTRYHIEVYDNIEGEIRNSEIGCIVGAGFTIPVFHLYRLYVSADYESGFKSIFETDTSLSADNYTRLQEYEKELRNRSIDLSFGLIMPVSSIKK